MPSDSRAKPQQPPTIQSRAAKLDLELKARNIPEVLRPQQARQLLGVSNETLRRLRADGQLDTFMVGKHHRYLRMDIARFRVIGREE